MEKLLSVVWKRNAELLNLFCMLWKKVRSDDDAGNGNIVVLQKKTTKKVLTMLIMFWFPSF